jgi:hypothetical protein
MSYKKDYSGQPEWMAKVDAMKDTQDYLGKPMFRKVVKLLKNDYRSPKHALLLALMLIGINGYPADVMIDLYAPKQLKLF